MAAIQKHLSAKSTEELESALAASLGQVTLFEIQTDFASHTP
jgi:hypothetical protein